MSTESTELPIDAAVGEASYDAADAFGLLADGTRLAILLALWEAYDPEADDNTMAFSDIFERVDYDDPGNLSYHLEKLQGQFVQHDTKGGGYKIRTTGLKFVRTIIAGAGVNHATLEPTELERACPLCGAPTHISYRDGLVVHACTECQGAVPGQTNPAGLLSKTPFDPAGLMNRSPEEIWAASTVAALRGAQTLFEGLCPACSGSVDGWFEYCEDHDATGTCENCDMKFAARAHFQCRICRNHKIEPPQGLFLFHPAVASFYDDQGISTRIHADDYETVSRFYNLMEEHEVDIISDDPIRVKVTAANNGDEIRLTFDDTVSVLDVRRRN